MDHPGDLRNVETGELKTEYQASGPRRLERARRILVEASPGLESFGAETLPETARPAAPEPEVPSAEPPVALFVTHGMGQQIPFQTLDDVVKGLREQDRDRRERVYKPGHPGRNLPPPCVSTVRIGEERLQRVELRLCRDAGQLEREVHVFESYWAPLVEGKVTLRDVLGFLLRAGKQGLSNGRKPFQRWLFGRYRGFGVRAATARILALALMVVASLIVANASILAVAAARSPLAETPKWLSNELVADLSTTFLGALAGLLVLGIPVAIAAGIPRQPQNRAFRRKLAVVGWGGLVIALLALALTGPLVLFLGSHHFRSPDSGELLKKWFGEGLVERFNAGLEVALWIAVLIGAAIGLAKMLHLLVRGGKRPGSGVEKEAVSEPRIGTATWLALAFVLLLATCWGWSFSISLGSLIAESPWRVLRRSISWPLLMGVSIAVRWLLVQFPGDVAVYVSPQVLDRFFELRREIQECVRRQADVVYGLRRPDGAFVYEGVFVVGHSLGSVVAYDTVNRLIVLDELSEGTTDPQARKRHLNALERTRLLLTFGSPLDKTAYLFALQGEATSETREALAAEVQPLIRHHGFRAFPWINIHSPQDIISGPLDFYDPPLGLSDPAEPVIDLGQVREWAEERNGFPARLPGGDPFIDPGMLRLGFSGAGETVERISWEEFAAVFDAGNLALYIQSTAEPGNVEHRLASRYRVDNRVDLEASTVLAAHVEYWRNPQLFQILHKEVTA